MLNLDKDYMYKMRLCRHAYHKAHTHTLCMHTLSAQWTVYSYSLHRQANCVPLFATNECVQFTAPLYTILTFLAHDSVQHSRCEEKRKKNHKSATGKKTATLYICCNENLILSMH